MYLFKYISCSGLQLYFGFVENSVIILGKFKLDVIQNYRIIEVNEKRKNVNKKGLKIIQEILLFNSLLIDKMIFGCYLLKF